jgi:hypothetical protein
MLRQRSAPLRPSSAVKRVTSYSERSSLSLSKVSMSPVHGAPPDDMSIPFLGHLDLSGRLEVPSSLVAGGQVLKNFGSSAVLGVLRGLVEMIA